MSDRRFVVIDRKSSRAEWVERTTTKRQNIFALRIRRGLSAWANFSQIVLVVFAVFGYFWTVRPIHQKELLDEQIAEATQKLQQVDNDAAKSRDELKQLGSMLDAKERAVVSERQLLEQLQGKFDRVSAKAQAAEGRASELAMADQLHQFAATFVQYSDDFCLERAEGPVTDRRELLDCWLVAVSAAKSNVALPVDKLRLFREAAETESRLTDGQFADMNNDSNCLQANVTLDSDVKTDAMLRDLKYKRLKARNSCSQERAKLVNSASYRLVARAGVHDLKEQVLLTEQHLPRWVHLGDDDAGNAPK